MSLSKEELIRVIQTLQRADEMDIELLNREFGRIVNGTANGVARPARGRGRAAGTAPAQRTARTERQPVAQNQSQVEAGADVDTSAFKEGQEVTYAKRRGEPLRGVVTKVTPKAVHFKGENGEERRVSPDQLQPVVSQAAMAGAQAAQPEMATA